MDFFFKGVKTERRVVFGVRHFAPGHLEILHAGVITSHPCSYEPAAEIQLPVSAEQDQRPLQSLCGQELEMSPQPPAD